MKPRGGDTSSVFEIDVKPIIGELARTQVCFPSIQLLVDKIVLETLPNRETVTGAFRLWLTDGEKSIQALVKRRHYKRVVIGDIREGSYILLKEYLMARANRSNGEGEVIYLVLKDFYAIGEDEREKPDIPDFLSTISENMRAEETKVTSQNDKIALERPFVDTSLKPSPKSRRLVDERPTPRLLGTDATNNAEKPNDINVLEPTANRPLLTSSPPDQKIERKRKLEIALGEIDPNFGSPPKRSTPRDESGRKNPPSAHSSKPLLSQEHYLMSRKANERTTPRLPAKPGSSRVNTNASLSYVKGATGPQLNKSKVTTVFRPAPGISSNRLAPVDRAMNIIPLSKLRGYTRRNDIYDVFVVVQNVSNEVIKRSRMPAKRDLRLVDPSTDKKVLLSVFVDPENFMPTAGTIALIRSVTTHEWDGGMINVYPKQCDGKKWFIPDPVGIPGCDVERMRQWWIEKLAAEAENSEEGKT